jgi:hypothetical protein
MSAGMSAMIAADLFVVNEIGGKPAGYLKSKYFSPVV